MSMALDIVAWLTAIAAVGIFLIYVVDAYRLSIFQFVMTLVIPFYVFYFAFIKSERSPKLLVALFSCFALFVIADSAKLLLAG